MRNIFLFLFTLITLASCSNKKKSSTPADTKDTTGSLPVVMDNLQKVTYKSATYYTGRVDFYFTDEKGAEVVVGISNFPEDSGAIYPHYLLESTDSIEGPPGENPAVVGKQFLLIKNKSGELREIKPVN